MTSAFLLGAIGSAAFFAAGLLLGNLWDRLGREINDMADGWGKHHAVSCDEPWRDSPMTLLPRHFLPGSWQIFLKRLDEAPDQSMVVTSGARIWRVLDELKLVRVSEKTPSKSFRVTMTGFGHVLVKSL